MPIKTTASQRRAMELRAEGLTFEEIGLQLGVTRQRAHQLVRTGNLRISWKFTPASDNDAASCQDIT